MIAPTRAETADMGTFIKGRFRRVAALTVFALGVPMAACGHSPPHRGGIDFIATLPDDVAVELLTYRLTASGFGGLAGGIHVSKPQQEFEKLINGIPVGQDYDLEIAATSLDGQLSCKGSAKVDVRLNTISRVHVPLTCGPGDGKLIINVGVVSTDSACKGVQPIDYMVAPLTASVGGVIFVTASMEASDAGAPTYQWSAPSGHFADPSAAHTAYQCEAPGDITLNLLVKIGDCAENQTVDVSCVAPPKETRD
jgi:hypothetical protein